MAQHIHHDDKHRDKDMMMEGNLERERLNEPGLMQADLKSGMAAAGAGE